MSDKLPKIQMRLMSPEIDEIARKLVPPSPHEIAAPFSGADRRHPNLDVLNTIVNTSAGNVNDSASIFQMLPETNLIMTLLVSSVLSPKDMVNCELTYAVTDKEIPSEIAGELLSIAREHFETNYTIKSRLSQYLEDALFKRGSAPLLVLPESVVDNAINGVATTEGLREAFSAVNSGSIGILGGNAGRESTDTYGFSLEAYVDTPVTSPDQQINTALGYRVVDDPRVLSGPALHDRIRKAAVSMKLGGLRPTLESWDSSKTAALTEVGAFPRRNFAFKPMLIMDTDGATAGHPNTMLLPSESVIPVHVAGDPTKHVGFFVLLDKYGNPLRMALGSDYMRDINANYAMQTKSDGSGGGVGQMLQTLSKGWGGFREGAAPECDELNRVYNNIVVEDMRKRLRNGVMGEDVDLPHKGEFFRIMWARALAGMQTQVLFVPEELLTYIAFDYNEFGMGCSYLESNKILGSIRSMLTFSDTMRSIRNAIGKTTMNIQLDEKDPDPLATVEDMVHEFVKTRQARYPVGVYNPQNIVSYLQSAGVELNVAGNVGYPETKLSVEDGQSQLSVSDSSLNDDLRKRWITSFGLTPEMVDSTLSPEFATAIVSNNLLLTKRVMVIQDPFSNFITKHCRTYLRYDRSTLGKMQKRLTELLKPDELTEHGEDYLERFLGSFQVSLPKPDTSKLKAQMEAYKEYSDSLELAMASYFDEAIFDSTAMGELADGLASFKASLLAHYRREWLAKNNVLPELNELINWTPESDGDDTIVSIQDQLKVIREALARYAEKRRDDVAKTNEEVTDADSAREETYGNDGKGSGGGGGGDDTPTDADGEGDDAFGDDGLDGDTDVESPDDTPDDTPEEEPEEEKPEEETPEEEPESEEEVEEEPAEEDDADKDENKV